MLITKEMRISEITKKYPETLNVFGNFRIDARLRTNKYKIAGSMLRVEP